MDIKDLKIVHEGVEFSAEHWVRYIQDQVPYVVSNLVNINLMPGDIYDFSIRLTALVGHKLSGSFGLKSIEPVATRDLLTEMRNYIEEQEVASRQDYDYTIGLVDILREGTMPEIYGKINKAIARVTEGGYHAR